MLQAERIRHQIVPRATALLLNDVTRAFVEPGAPLEIPDGRAILPGLADLARACRAAGALVVFCGYVQTEANRAEMGTFWPSLLKGALDKGALGAELPDILKPEPQD